MWESIHKYQHQALRKWGIWYKLTQVHKSSFCVLGFKYTFLFVFICYSPNLYLVFFQVSCAVPPSKLIPQIIYRDNDFLRLLDHRTILHKISL